jgi:predicted O-linked N-acetylglucosamine transferase (SPINDLY family)
LYGFTRYISPEAEKVLAEGWEKIALTEEERSLARRRASPTSGVFPFSSRKGRRLRLGIVSADLGSHAAAYFLEPILEELDRSRFHLTLFPTLGRSGPRAERFRELAEGYISLVELSDSLAAERIRLEQIDVLVDATGHTFGGRLGVFAHRAAPVQCAYIGYCGTTGLTEMDWVFGERCLAAHFTEKVWEIPPVGICYRGESYLPESSWVPDPHGKIWLGSLSRYGKIGEETLSLWAKVLHALPEARLLLEDGRPCEEETHQRILSTLSGWGISAERVEFIPFIPGHERHMDLYNRLDIALETIPYNGGTTAFDALWMGVPLAGLEGNWAGGRMGSILLKAFDRPEWVARDEAEYVSIVCKLARDVEERKRQRREQRARMQLSPLCDAKGMTRSLEGAFEAMFDIWVAGAQGEPAESACQG